MYAATVVRQSLLILRSCDLEQDIATFPDGHDTQVGSKGLTLSSGQKHRIAIARAVYARKDFVIFDDTFSGLDRNTQKNVFSRLLGPTGLLRRWNTSVLVATHAGRRGVSFHRGC
jgi:ATP-binding cassette subfamily C (CFTR/MRP) protein 1